MVHSRSRRLIGVVVALLIGADFGQAARALDEKPPQFRASTEQVFVDFVVRGKKSGALIEDLVPADVEVFEDGVRQEIESLRLVRRHGEAAPSHGPEERALPAAPAPDLPSPAGAPGDPELVALVFDNVEMGYRGHLRESVTEYLRDHWHPGQHVGIFAIGLNLGVVQPFTDDRDAVLSGVERALGWQAAEGLVRKADEGVLASVNDRLPGPRVAVPGRQGGPPNTDFLLARLSDDGPEAVGLRRDTAGMTSLRSLLAIVNALSAAHGRKAIVYLGDALRLGPRTEGFLFQSLVPAANDAQVSIYTTDAAGLGVASETQALKAELPASAGGLDPFGRGNPGDAGAIRQETVGEVFNATPIRALAQVADGTGGAMVYGSNSLARAIQQADEDLTSYYVLAYSPKNENYDGSFRRIGLKVRRPHGELRARKGYIAVRTREWDSPVLAYEGPALARLDRDPKANQFPLRAEALAIPSGSDKMVAAVFAEFRAADLSRRPDRKADLFREDFTIVAVVRDATGRVARKMSEYYPLRGPLDRIGEAGRRKILFYREADLGPGAYTVDLVVRDNQAGTASVRHLDLEVPHTEGSRLRASSLVVVGSSGLARPEASESFVTNGVQILPSLDGSVTADAAGRAVVFVRAWPAPARATVEASLEIRAGESAITTADLGRLVADDSGHLDVLGRFPVSSLPAGEYEVRVTLQDGRDSETRSASFHVEGGTP